MKNPILILAACLLFAGITSCNNKAKQTDNNKQNQPVMFARLKARSAELAKASDWVTIQSKAEDLFHKIEADSNDIKSKLLLAQLYMQEARITGEHPYYYPATLVILDDVLRHDPANFEALAFKASVQLSLHHFKEALETGNIAKNINANNGFIYGVLCDANVELGHYEDAVQMSDRMQAVRPGLESYSRASYLREIYGDNKGAIDAMKMAFQAGLPGSEEASWAGNTLSHLYENTGDLKDAEDITNVILQQRPSYAFATDALGRIALAKGEYDKAIMKFEEAAKVMPEFSFYENMALAYEAKGDSVKAREIYTSVIKMLEEDAASGHYADMDMALVYLKLGAYDKALEHAKREYERRPDNIDVNNTLGWVFYHMGNYDSAKKHMAMAMRMGTQNAVLLARAGIAEQASGNIKGGQELISKAKKINPYLPADLAKKCQTAKLK